MTNADLVLHNANVLTMANDSSNASIVAIVGERIAYVGDKKEFRYLVGARTKVIDCQGGTLLPGFHDAHCHLLGLVSKRAAINCEPPAVQSLSELQRTLGERAAQVRTGDWIRASGYHEFNLVERRHPTREELDLVTPRNPVSISHQSGHAHVLNTLALEKAGINSGTPDPREGVIERNENGEPTGLLLEMGPFLDTVIPSQSLDTLEKTLQEVNRDFLSLGITSIQDATESNNLVRWEMLRRLKSNNSLTPNLTMMPGLSHLREFQEKGLRFGTETDGVRLGHAKGMLNLTTGAPQPPIEELTEMIENAESAGFPIALHAIEQEAIEIAINLLERGQKRNLRHRIEHAAECPPETLSTLSKIGIGVVAQPGFIYSNGDRYISEVPAEMQPWLYRMNSLQQALPWVAASSDAPVGNLNPMLGVYAAITRNTQNGQQIAPEEKITIQEALALYTKNAAWATCDEANKGTITAGGVADLVLFSKDPTKANPDELMKLKIQLTMVKGQSGM